MQSALNFRFQNLHIVVLNMILITKLLNIFCFRKKLPTVVFMLKGKDPLPRMDKEFYMIVSDWFEVNSRHIAQLTKYESVRCVLGFTHLLQLIKLHKPSALSH